MILRLTLMALASSICMMAAQHTATAQPPGYPSQLLTIVVPAPPGGVTDILARIISKHLDKVFKQGVVVVNQSGASGNIGTASAARAAPDGYTLLLGANNNVIINKFTFKNLGYDPLTDFEPVALIADSPQLVTISSKFPAQNLKEFIEALRAKPGVYNYGSPGIGSVPHLSVERLMRATGTSMTHVPYRGAAAALTDLASGNIQMTTASLGSVEPFRQAGTARILAVAGAQRLKAIPDVPTLRELGWNDLEMSGWWCVMAPKGTSPEIRQFLNAKLREVLSSPDVVGTLERVGIVSRSESVEFLEKLMLSEMKAWERVVKDIGLQPQ